jgi:hypothetical protein
MIMYKNWINSLLGLVVVAVAFMDLSATTMMWTLSIAGAIIAFSNLWSLFVEQDYSEDSAIGHHV